MADAERAPRSLGAKRAEPSRTEAQLTNWLARWFSRIEDLVYVGLAVILAALALGLLVDGAVSFARAVMANELAVRVAVLLDRLLLILMVVEILYTVQVSFREHVLVPEPFVLVAMIAAVRRILVLTAEFGKLMAEGEAIFRYAMIELGLLTVMTGVMVACLMGLRKRDKEAVAERA